ncbi:hypothetical protein BOTCAL_0185g00200 [Botryotinia calthae]|uniref:ATP synthase F(0) complex subunit e, mitochondrial n=1 Tax=Botryotinia calthae TaxID=38488 RepID=A0A4Y8D0X0_9HELO|nr:hypothetical protein BOTCAL_0185g00200 [Botryotinia calthae]
MASTGVNVLRWSALGAGVFYGFYHQMSLSSAAKAAAASREFEHKQKLIEQARADQKTGGGDIIRDPMDKNFDLEAYLKVLAAEN